MNTYHRSVADVPAAATSCHPPIFASGINLPSPASAGTTSTTSTGMNTEVHKKDARQHGEQQAKVVRYSCDTEEKFAEDGDESNHTQKKETGPGGKIKASKLHAHAPSLSASFSSLTTSSTSSLGSTTISHSSSGPQDEDRRLYNMPKELASKCVEAFIAWGHDHKGNPSGYQQFLRLNLPLYPGIDAEKVRLYMKNICATYHERYLPARARGYTQGFQAWWDKRPGRGRPKKDVRMSSAYALAHHLDPTLARSRSRGHASAENNRGGHGGGPEVPKRHRRRNPTKRAKSAKAMTTGGESSMQIASDEEVHFRASNGEDANEIYYYGSDYGEDGDDQNNLKGKPCHFGAGESVLSFSKSGRAVRCPTDPYSRAVQEEASKRARIEAALAMIEMDTGKNRSRDCNPHSTGRHTPSPPVFNPHIQASIYPVRHQGRAALRIQSPVPLSDHDVTAILADLRSDSLVAKTKSGDGHPNRNGKDHTFQYTIDSSSAKDIHTGASFRASDGLTASCSAASADLPPQQYPFNISHVASSAHRKPLPNRPTYVLPSFQALAGLVNLRGPQTPLMGTPPGQSLAPAEPRAPARPRHYSLPPPHPHSHAIAGHANLTTATSHRARVASASSRMRPAEFFVFSDGGQVTTNQYHAPPSHVYACNSSGGSPPVHLFHEYNYHPHARNRYVSQNAQAPFKPDSLPMTTSTINERRHG